MDTVVPEATKYRFERNKRNGSRGDYLYSYHDSSLLALLVSFKARKRGEGEIKRGRRPLLKIDGTGRRNEREARNAALLNLHRLLYTSEMCDKRSGIRVSNRTKGRYFLLAPDGNAG